jgi:hypothetical protein
MLSIVLLRVVINCAFMLNVVETTVVRLSVDLLCIVILISPAHSLFSLLAKKTCDGTNILAYFATASVTTKKA